MQDRDKKMLQMIIGTITPDGVVNLQAKNIIQNQQTSEQSTNQDVMSADKESSDSFVSASSDRYLDLHNIFGAGALTHAEMSGPVMLKRFLSIVKLNLSSNRIQMIKTDFCQCLPNVQVLDLRANRIADITQQINLLSQLRVLKLDKNELTTLPQEIFEILTLRELTFQQNRVQFLSPKIGDLKQLKKLNIASNIISKIPETIGQCLELETLCIQNNRFASFPCSFLQLTNLRELSLEWFIYAKPPKPQYISKKTRDGQQIFESLMVLCNLLQKYKMNECALITFLENYSDDNFDKNQRDNRQRTPLHKAAVMGDTGVIDGLLMDKANTDLLDKDSCTPLCLAIRQENYEAAQSLIEFGANCNMGGGIFGSPVHLSVVRLKIPIIQALINKNADLNKQDSDGNTPLHIVMNIFSKNPERCCHILELLTSNGARVNQKNHDHWAPLHTAVRKGQEKGVNAIIQLNQMLNDRNLDMFDLNITGGVQQWSSLHLAAHASQLQIIIDLTRAGADIFQRNHTNQLPRHCAKGNYIMTKNIKHIEQKCLAVHFNHFVLKEFLLASITLRELQRQLLRQQNNSTGSSNIKDSKMQPIKKTNGNQTTQVNGNTIEHQTKGKEKNQTLQNYLVEKSYQSFAHHLLVSKRTRQGAGLQGGQRPFTHLKSHAPISRKHMAQGGEIAAAESDDDVWDGLDDFPLPIIVTQKRKYGKDQSRKRENVLNNGDYEDQIQQPYDVELDAVAQQADTLKANDDDSPLDIDSIDAEYDVVEEDEARLSRRIQQNVVGQRNIRVGKNSAQNKKNNALSNNFFQKPSNLILGDEFREQSQASNSFNGKPLENTSLYHQRINSSYQQIQQSTMVLTVPPTNVQGLVELLLQNQQLQQKRNSYDPTASQVSKSSHQSSYKLTSPISKLSALNNLRNIQQPSQLPSLIPLVSPPLSFHSLECSILQSDVLNTIQMALHSSTMHLQPDLGQLQSMQSALNRILQDETTELDIDVRDRVQETIEVIAHTRKIAASRRVAAVAKAAVGGSHQAKILARHQSPCQNNQMEGGQSHIVAAAGLQSGRSSSRQRPQTMVGVGAKKRAMIQSFGGSLVPPMQLLYAGDDKNNNEDVSLESGFGRQLNGTFHGRQVHQNSRLYGGLENIDEVAACGPQSMEPIHVELEDKMIDLDDTIRESKSYIENEGNGAQQQVIMVRNDKQTSSFMIQDNNWRQSDSNLELLSQKNLGKQVNLYRSFNNNCKQVQLLPQQNAQQMANIITQSGNKHIARNRFQKVLNDINQHRSSQPPENASANLSINFQNNQSAAKIQPEQKQLLLNSLIENGHQTGVLSNDKLPSSPQSINIFNNNIAKNIHQMGQRKQQRQSEMCDGYLGMPDMQNHLNQSRIKSMEDSSILQQQLEKEEMIIQKQNVINTQRGLNPISPQSIDITQMHNQFAGPQSQRSVGNFGQSMTDLSGYSDTRTKRKDAQVLQRKISPGKLITQQKNQTKKNVRKSALIMVAQPGSKERKSNKSQKRSDPLFAQATQKAIRNKRSGNQHVLQNNQSKSELKPNPIPIQESSASSKKNAQRKK